jgi:hypothetical protein
MGACNESWTRGIVFLVFSSNYSPSESIFLYLSDDDDGLSNGNGHDAPVSRQEFEAMKEEIRFLRRELAALKAKK